MRRTPAETDGGGWWTLEVRSFILGTQENITASHSSLWRPPVAPFGINRIIFQSYTLVFVSAGRRGYAASSKLSRYHQPAEEPPPSPHLSLPDGLAGLRRHSYAPEARPLALPGQACFQVMNAHGSVCITRWCVALFRPKITFIFEINVQKYHLFSFDKLTRLYFIAPAHLHHQPTKMNTPGMHSRHFPLLRS